MARSALMAVREGDVLLALARVRDPELDEPITDLGFVRSVDLDGGSVTVHLRLPTSFYSTHFASPNYIQANAIRQKGAKPKRGSQAVTH